MTSVNNLNIGDILGGFKIEKELGKGGMGVVYKAHELSLNRKVALKVLSKRLSSDEEFIKRFKREAEVVAALNHPNIINMLSYGEEHDHYYFAMEYVRGKDLGQLLKEKSVIPLEEALSITAQVSNALDEASARGVVHRDLKPQNIMIDEMGRVKVTDFGVAHLQYADTKLTRTGLFLGTPEYASPEQARGQPLDVKSDIYSLGAVLFKMLSGEPPVAGDSPLAVVAKIITEPVTPIDQVNPSVPKPVCELIERMMAKEPVDRLQSPRDVLVAIEDCIDKLEVDVPLAKSKIADLRTLPPPLPKRKSYAKLLGATAGVALAILLSVWIVDAVFLKKKSPSEPKEVTQPSAPVEELTKKKPIEEAVKKVPTKEVANEALIDKIARKSPPKRVESKRTKTLPKIPTLLMAVSGDDAMIPFVRMHLESIIAGSGLRLISTSEIPVLREKMQFGTLPVTWYSIKQFVPTDKANILLLAKIQKTGSMPLQYYGRTQELTVASFSVQAVDMATGTSAAGPATGSVKYTPLNMEENFKKAITSAAEGMGVKIKKYWQQKLKRGGKAG